MNMAAKGNYNEEEKLQRMEKNNLAKKAMF